VTRDPLHYVWWLISRAAGVLALVLISLSVLMGLAMAARALPNPRSKGAVARLHEHVALTALGATVAHGASLLGDGWLKPGMSGIAVPFAMSYRPPFTAAGISAGYLLALVGPSFYLRRRIGSARWRKLHRFSPAVWALAVVHTLGAGSDAAAPWLRAVVLAPLAPIVYLLVWRTLRERTAGQTRARRVSPTLPRESGRTRCTPYQGPLGAAPGHDQADHRVGDREHDQPEANRAHDAEDHGTQGDRHEQEYRHRQREDQTPKRDLHDGHLLRGSVRRVAPP
jgi:methionine sulfoxide reductase heme-binding subunit